MLTFIVRYGYVPFVLLGINGAAIALAASGAPKWSLVALILFAVVCSFAAERALPYESSWNAPGPDRFRDAVHAFVYESLILVSVAVIPLMAAVIPFDGLGRTVFRLSFRSSSQCWLPISASPSCI
ncbi:MAG: hypothetical protein ACI9JD_004104 [Rhodococcus sp. (in: high G+C Gram-positive bacteria)]|jgi:hypothetical protein